MKNEHIVKLTIGIKAPVEEVWNALIDPDLIKKYLFGTNVITDWKVGSPILYKGMWKGKAYEDKGIILNIIPNRLLETTYWSGMSGIPDIPENYKKVNYKLVPNNNGTSLTLTQDNNATEEEKKHSEQNWKMVLDGLKKILE